MYLNRKKNPTNNLYGLSGDIMQTQSYCWKVHRFVITCVVISEYPNISSRDFISAAAVGNLPSPAYQILVPK